MTEETEPNGEPQVEPESYHGQQERVHDPRDDMREAPPDPGQERRFYANGVSSVTRKLRAAIERTETHDFEDARSEVEDALDDLERLDAGPDTDD